MEFIRRHKLEIVILAILIIIYFSSRLFSILSLPIFTDEAIYIRWAQIAKQDANWRFISLTDGKQPMFIWLMMISLRFIQDPLLAGRVVSVGAGFMTLIGMYFLGKEIFKSNKIGLISSALYVIFPMALVYDRMALYDGLVGSFAVWALFLIILLVRKIRLDIALILGMVVGAGVLTKTNAFFSIYLLPLSLILFNWKEKQLKVRLIKWISLAIAAIVITYGFYSILRLSPYFHIITEKNALFVYPFTEWIKHPFNFFINNWEAVWDWLTRYMTWPMEILVIASFFISKSFVKEKLLLFIWFLVPALALAIFGKTLYARFIFFMILPLLIINAYSLRNIYLRVKNKLFFGVLLIVIFALSVKADYFILSDLGRAPIPVSDLGQYSNDWPSGGGVKEAVAFFKNEAKKGKIYIATQGTFGLMPYALEIYLVDHPKIKIEGYWPVGDKVPEKVLEKSKKIPTYFVFYQPCVTCRNAGDSPDGWNLEEVLRIKKHADNFMTVYRVR